MTFQCWSLMIFPRSPQMKTIYRFSASKSQEGQCHNYLIRWFPSVFCFCEALIGRSWPPFIRVRQCPMILQPPKSHQRGPRVPTASLIVAAKPPWNATMMVRLEGRQEEELQWLWDGPPHAGCASHCPTHRSQGGFEKRSGKMSTQYSKGTLLLLSFLCR